MQPYIFLSCSNSFLRLRQTARRLRYTSRGFRVPYGGLTIVIVIFV